MIYRNLFIIYILLFIKICIIFSKKITLNAIIYLYFDVEIEYYESLIEGFNNHSINNGLDIQINLKILTPKTSTKVIENYGSTVDSLLSKKSKKYDIYYYYSAYSKKYGDHFLDLKKYLPEEYIENFDENLLKETCYKDDNLVGLPINLYISTLFSNQILLDKYKKQAPKTWDELLNTSKYIYDEEKKKNNTIIRYNGLFDERNGSMSVYEFINSFRESNDSPHPEITSKTTIEALDKIKEMKDEIGEDIFRASDDLTFSSLFGEGKMLFIRYFYGIHAPIYRGYALPGKKEGVSGTIVVPNNFAVNKYIDDERKKAAVEFMKYISLKETQKKYIIKNGMFSGIIELYDDEEVCKLIECNIVKDAYPFSFMSNDVNLFGDDNYHIKYKNNMYNYIYDNQPVSDVLKAILDITKIYSFSFITDGSYAGLIIFFFFIILTVNMVLSVVFIYIKKLENKFKFLSKGLWVITILGSLILMSSIFTLYGEVSDVKCHLRITLINVGFVLSICPSLYKLITNFPKSNKLSLVFENNKYISILMIMLITVGLNEIFAMTSYDIKEFTTSNGKNYKKCVMSNTLGRIFYYIIQIYNFTIILISLILIFMEWNLKETKLDVKYLATALFMDTLSLILLITIENKFDDFIIYSVLLAINIMIFSVSNHIFIYLVRILPIFRSNEKYENTRKILGKLSGSGPKESKKPSMSSSSYKSYRSLNDYSSKNMDITSSMNSTSYNDAKLSEITKKIISYHNQTNISIH